MPQQHEEQQKSKRSGVSQNWLELLVSLVSGLAILAVALYLIWQGLQTETPPGFEIFPEKPRQAGSMYQVPVQVRNTGDEAAQAVELSIRLKQSGKPDQESQATIDWLPGHSMRRAVAVFRDNPEQGEISAEVKGYQAP